MKEGSKREGKKHEQKEKLKVKKKREEKGKGRTERKGANALKGMEINEGK